MRNKTIENPEVKYLRAYRELNAIVADRDPGKLANWLKTHQNHAYSHLPEDNNLKVEVEKSGTW